METDEAAQKGASALTDERSRRAELRRALREQWLIDHNDRGGAIVGDSASAVSTAAVAAIAMHDEDGEDGAVSPPLPGQTAPVGGSLVGEPPATASAATGLASSEVPQPMALTAVVAAANSLDAHSLEATLHQFGLTAFREGQREVVEAVLSGRDALVVWPTDRGKSLVYQLPAIHTGKLVVVIEPNISLMDNQVPRPIACTAAASHHPPCFAQL